MRGYLLIISTLIIIISALITLGIFFQGSLQIEMAEQFNKHQLLLSQAISNNITAYFFLLKQEALHIAKILPKLKMPQKVYDELQHELIIKTDIGILNPKGEIIFFNGDKNSLKSLIPNILNKCKAMNPGSAVLIEKPPLIYTISPIYKQNKFEGVILFSSNISDIVNYFINNIKIDSKGYVWIMDKKGNLLYHPTQPEMVGKNLYKADPTCFKCHRNFDFEKKIIEGKTEEFGRHIAPTGEDKILAFFTLTIDDILWIVSASAPYSEITYAIKKSMRLYSYLILSIFAATGMVSVLLIISNKKRIKAEESAKRKEELERYTVELEKEVNERTAEIMSEKEKIAHSEKLASLGRFAAGIAHEIGNPLTSIFSFIQILKEIEKDEFKKENLRIIYFHINRISDILKQLTGFTKMPTGEVKECPIDEIIENSVNIIIRFDKKIKGISVVKDFSPALHNVTCICEDKQLSQVFINLALNAIDAMPNGGTLTIRRFLKDGNIVIQFEDTGFGIPREDLSKIFDPFYTTKEKGTGLGLAVSYDIIKKIKGTITVESEIGKGSIFTITIPFSQNVIARSVSDEAIPKRNSSLRSE